MAAETKLLVFAILTLEGEGGGGGGGGIRTASIT